MSTIVRYEGNIIRESSDLLYRQHLGINKIFNGYC